MENSFTKMEACTLVNIKNFKKRVSENLFNIQVISMRDPGKTIKRMEKVDFIMHQLDLST
jgi:hypothetical protein